MGHWNRHAVWVRSLQCYYNVLLVFVGMCAQTRVIIINICELAISLQTEAPQKRLSLNHDITILSLSRPNCEPIGYHPGIGKNACPLQLYFYGLL